MTKPIVITLHMLMCLALIPLQALSEEVKRPFGFSSSMTARNAMNVSKIYMGNFDTVDPKSESFVEQLKNALGEAGFIVVNMKHFADVQLTGILVPTDTEKPYLEITSFQGAPIWKMPLTQEVICKKRCQKKSAQNIVQDLLRNWKEGQVFPE